MADSPDFDPVLFRAQADQLMETIKPAMDLWGEIAQYGERAGIPQVCTEQLILKLMRDGGLVS